MTKPKSDQNDQPVPIRWSAATGEPSVIRLPFERKLLTLDLAKVIHEMQRSPRERPLSKRHLTGLIRELSPCPAEDFRWALALLRETNEWCRVNGQHTALLYATEMLPIPEGCYVSLQRYECATTHDVSWLWNKFDHPVGVRTGQDMVAAWAAAFVELRDVHRMVPNAALTGVCLAAGKWESTAIDTERKIQDNIPFILFVNSLVAPYMKRQDKFKKILLRVSVQAALNRTWQHDPVAAIVYWSEVASGDSRPGSPARTCREYLLGTKVASGYGMKDVDRDASRAMMEKCLVCWNAWRRGVKRMPTIRLDGDGTAGEVL